ncbi:Wadjet anti-phage system protein JetA family protein [uncultured Pseudoteredinibacter sp.]|uniref:Wadjet anti-phage system protein JetA family protein n=1 Tax=uncultured Pseudoteredinibacter sp. TaxID=1641701 RepID=UPI00262E4D10|nr:Wadjet anti-phage system protein JetA family protein [uncultured Pseudoteredinibacter sp.]
MFFSAERLHFFKALTGKYRAQVAGCLTLLYQRQYSATADYGHAPDRDLIIDIFTEALARNAKLVLESDSEDGADQELRFKTPREQASWLLKLLIDCGWIERQVDPATLATSFPFSRMGRVFAQALLEADSSQIRTRHRNTRNTLNSLEAFHSRAEVYDLLDAFDHSERIITDFTDIIAELEERKRELVREVEAEQLVQQASEQFFEFMEKRFQPDIQVRLSADSVEKYRDDIKKIIRKIRSKPKSFKQQAELELRRVVPDLCSEDQSYLYFLLEQIEQRMRSAADIMLPALRSALHGFTKRADIIIRQLSYLHSQADNNLVETCRELADLDEESFQQRLSAAAEECASMRLAFIDPAQIKWQERKSAVALSTAVQEAPELDSEAQRELMIQQLLDQAFVNNKENLRNYIVDSLRGGRQIATSELQIEDAHSLMSMASAIEIGAVNNQSSDLQFDVQYLSTDPQSNEYFENFDEFTIELRGTAPATDK